MGLGTEGTALAVRIGALSWGVSCCLVPENGTLLLNQNFVNFASPPLLRLPGKAQAELKASRYLLHRI
jgi:hypothetical protein